MIVIRMNWLDKGCNHFRMRLLGDSVTPDGQHVTLLMPLYQSAFLYWNYELTYFMYGFHSL